MSGQAGEEQGKRQTREPVFLIPGVVLVLVGLMVAAHVATLVLHPLVQQHVLLLFGFIPARAIIGLEMPSEWLPLLWTPVTHAFLHANWEHLGLNSVWLAIFATPVARRYGALATAGVFFACAVAGAAAFALTAFLAGQEGGFVLIGASGGVAGLTGAATRFVFQPAIYGVDPETERTVPLGRRMASLRDVIANPRSRYFTLVWLALNAAVPLLPSVGADLAIAWQAHLGGFICGLLMVPLFERRGQEP